MKVIEVTIRGYKGLKRKAFETMQEIMDAMKESDIVKSMNAYLGAHPFNSAFEAELVKRAEAAGHKMKTEKSDKGNDVVIETNAEFLKRVEFKVSPADAQAIVDSLAWPPEATERTARVDAYTKVAKERVQKAIDGGKSLAQVSKKLEAKGFAPEDATNQDSVVAAFANYLRSDDTI
jgi:hypothetical protein